MRKRNVRTIFTAVVAVCAVGASASAASATKPDPSHKITICHATASTTNPYVVITVDIAGIVGDAGHGRSGINAGDIIPPFQMDDLSYPGNNWDEAHMGILEDGCGTGVSTTTGING